MTDPARRVYSPERFRLVLILLTVVTLPFVIGASILIYYVRAASASWWTAASRASGG